ncbi:MAG: hypothetical protein WDA59_11660 [Methanofastidiosum sp.]|jgi:hypothetical protein
MKTLKLKNNITQETEKAVKVLDYWLPKSQIEIKEDGIYVEDWLMMNKIFDGYNIQTALYCSDRQDEALKLKKLHDEIFYSIRDEVGDKEASKKCDTAFLEYIKENYTMLKEHFASVESTNMAVKHFKKLFENYL